MSKHSHRVTLFLLGILFAVCSDTACALNVGLQFTSGHIYTPVSSLTGNARIVEWDRQLNILREIPINAEGTTGATFNDRDNLVVITRRDDRVRVVEYDAAGNAVGEYVDDPGASLLLGSYIDFEPVRKIYAFADDERVTLLDDGLNFISASAAIFERASGVTFAPDGSLYVADQSTNVITHFDSSLSIQRQFHSGGSITTGIEVSKTGHLLVTLWGNGRLDRIDLQTLSSETLVSGLGRSGISDVFELPNGNLLTTSERNVLSLFDEDGGLISSRPGVGAFGDGVAFLVPEPSPMAMLLLLAIGLLLLIPNRGHLSSHSQNGTN